MNKKDIQTRENSEKAIDILNKHEATQRIIQMLDRQYLKIAKRQDRNITILEQCDMLARIMEQKQQYLTDYLVVEKTLKHLTEFEVNILKRCFASAESSFKIAEELNMSIRTFFRRKHIIVKKFLRQYNIHKMLECNKDFIKKQEGGKN